MQNIRKNIKSRLKYSNVFNNTDIIYDMNSYQVKESIVIHNYNAAVRGYQYNLDTDGLLRTAPLLKSTRFKMFNLLLSEKGIGKMLFRGIMWMGFSIAGISNPVARGIDGMVDDYLSNMLSFKNTFLRRSYSLISSISSIGGVIALFMDISDDNWDGRFTIKL